MKSSLLTIMKKEFARFFGDKRMVFTTILMPGLIIYIMYSFMGSGFSQMYETEEDYAYDVRTVDLPQSMAMLKDIDDIDLQEADRDDIDAVKTEIKNETADILVVFPEDFDEKVAMYDVTTAAEAAPNIEIYYNSAAVNSGSAYQMMIAIFDQVEASMVNKFDIDAGEGDYDLASEEDMTTMIFAMILPMLVMVFLFSGCLAISSESIAGEKERGTIATLLVTPMKRSELALGKMLSLSVIGLLSGCSSFIGTMLSLPKIVGSEMGEMRITYSAADYLLLLVVILSTTIIIVGAISVISAFAKTVKEAATYVSPLMILVVVISLTSMMGGGTESPWYLFLIPLYNSVQCMTGIFSMDYGVLSIGLTVVSNVVYSGILVAALTKMFDSERIMYT